MKRGMNVFILEAVRTLLGSTYVARSYFETPRKHTEIDFYLFIVEHNRFHQVIIKKTRSTVQHKKATLKHVFAVWHDMNKKYII
jgi:hypothetical protein